MIRIPDSRASSVVPYIELESVDTTGQGDYGVVPLAVQVGDEAFIEIRLMHGLYVDVNLKNGDVSFTERNLEAMRRSENAAVINFLKVFDDTLTKMAKGEGQTLGFLRPVKKFLKTEFPCTIPFTSTQMFEATDDIQEKV